MLDCGGHSGYRCHPKLVPIHAQEMRNPEFREVCTILDKPSCRKADIQPDYEGFQVPDEFVVGYDRLR